MDSTRVTKLQLVGKGQLLEVFWEPATTVPLVLTASQGVEEAKERPALDVPDVANVHFAGSHGVGIPERQTMAQRE